MTIHPPIKIAVLGSCATRDVFNRKFCPNYNETFTCVASQLQGSLISVLSTPFEIPERDLSVLNPDSARDVRSETRRELSRQLSEQQPEYLIVDMFGDVRFGVSKLANGALITKNDWKISKTRYFKEESVAHVPIRSEEHFVMWREAADQIRHYVKAASPNTRIILHDVEFVSNYRKRSGEVAPLPGTEYFETLNQWWRKLNTYFANNIADETINVRDGNTISFEDHPWGAYGVHYEYIYHARFLYRLLQLALRDSLLEKSDNSIPGVNYRL